MKKIIKEIIYLVIIMSCAVGIYNGYNYIYTVGGFVEESNHNFESNMLNLNVVEKYQSNYLTKSEVVNIALMSINICIYIMSMMFCLYFIIQENKISLINPEKKIFVGGK